MVKMASVIIQERQYVGLEQGVNSEVEKKQLDSVYILEMESTEFSDGFYVEHEKKGGSKNDSISWSEQPDKWNAIN